MVERQQYAAWKAADIRKALREGRVPQAGPPVQEDSLDLPDVPGKIFCHTWQEHLKLTPASLLYLSQALARASITVKQSHGVEFDLHKYWVFKSPHLPASRFSDWIVLLSEQIGCSMIEGLDAGAKPPTGDNTLGSASSGPNIFPAKPGPSHQNDTSQPASPPRGAPPPNLHAGEASQKPRFRPGSKVFYNPFDGPPVKGTVVSIQPSQYGELPLFRL